MEHRVLLSAYALSDVGTFGINGSGAAPNSTMVVDSDGNFYGTTAQGGAYGLGTVFEIAGGSQKATALAAFNGSNGSAPNGVAVDPSGNVYGTTPTGGPANDGTVFEIAKGSQVITTLVSFNGTNGKSPWTRVILDASGNLYGTTESGGTSNAGTLFEIPAGSTTITTLVMFTFNSEGVSGLTLDSAGNLYGTTSTYGTVFELPKGSNALTTLATFNGNGANGSGPGGDIALDAAGNLYGAANQGGANGFGTVFEVASGTHAVTALASFNGANGEDPEGVTLDAAGNLYGTTLYGGASHSASNSGYNTVFEVAKGSNAITALSSFANQTGPIAGLTLGNDGNLYGTTEGGGTGDTGMMFAVADSSGTVTPLASFDPIDGVNPFAAPAVDAVGNVFGMANGGAFNDGMVFEIAKGSNTVTVLAAFDGADGQAPTGQLIVDASGNIFGTTNVGGSNNGGTVFEIANGSNAITTVASLSTINTTGGLTVDGSDDVFLTSRGGGMYGAGQVDEIAAGTGAITTYASFSGSSGTGSDPQTPVTFDHYGNLYGTTNYGGPSNLGTIFEIPRASHTITTLGSFSQTIGANPSQLVVDGEGNLYGAASSLGPGGDGSVFELPKGSNTISVLASMAGYGSQPAGVALDAFGDLYGTLPVSSTGKGSVFGIAKGSSALTVLATFNGANGDTPRGVTVDPLGDVYGLTSLGGSANDGTAFELTPNTSVTLAPAGAANPADPSQPLTFTASVAGSGGIPDWETVLLVDASNDDQVVAGGLLHGGTTSLTIPAGRLAPGTHELVAAYGGDATLTASQSARYTQVVQSAPPPPALTGAPTINGDNPNGLFNPAGQTTPGQQRSMVEDVVYTFNEPVTITNANLAFTLAVAGPGGGTLPATLYAQAVAGSNGTQWAVSLTGQPVGTLASIANGEYSITINPSSVFAAADGTTSMAAGTGRTDSFYRLYGDVFGTKNVTALDYSRFKSSLTTFNPMFDNYGTGNITALDYALFKKDLSVNYSSDGFITTI